MEKYSTKCNFINYKLELYGLSTLHHRVFKKCFKFTNTILTIKSSPTILKEYLAEKQNIDVTEMRDGRRIIKTSSNNYSKYSSTTFPNFFNRFIERLGRENIINSDFEKLIMANINDYFYKFLLEFPKFVLGIKFLL